MSIAALIAARQLLLDPTEKGILCCLADYADENDQSFTHLGTVADDTCHAPEVIKSALASLEAKGYIARTYDRYNGAGYELIFLDRMDSLPLVPKREHSFEPREPEPPQSGYVYYAKFDDGIVKIGCSVNPKGRLATLRGSKHHKHHRMVSAFCYPADDQYEAEREAHELHGEHLDDRRAETFRLLPGTYETRLEETGGTVVYVRRQKDA